MSELALTWVLFNVGLVVLLALDLFVFNRKAHVIRFGEALGFSALWVGIALAFGVSMVWWRPPGDALKFATGYVVELSLSVDNLFVFLMLFTYFRVAGEHQHRVLFWGIVGAIGMRISFILLGVTLINNLQWIMFAFGAFLVFTGIKMAVRSDEEVHPEHNPVLRLARRWLPVTHEYHGGQFFTRQAGRLVATPLFVVLLVVETTDLAFAVDSVPAVIGIIQDPVTRKSDMFIAYSSNICAILGLRAMYFALAGLMRTFHLLHYGLAAILAFVGGKMLLEAAEHYDLLPWGAPLDAQGRPLPLIPVWLSLTIVGGLLIVAVAASLLWPRRVELRTDPSPADPLA